MEEKKKVNLSSYRDVTAGFSNTELLAGSWYLRHKVLLRHILIGVLATWAIASLLVTVGAWGYYGTFGYFDDRDDLSRFIMGAQNYDVTNESMRALDVVPRNIQTYRSSPGKIDFVGRVSNSNERWIAEMEYHFAHSGGETPKAITIVLPGRDQTFGIFGVDIEGFPTAPNLIIDDVRYRKISAHAVRDVADFMRTHINFPVSDFSVVNPGDNFGIDDVDYPIISFDVTNDTPYSYWDPVFVVELRDGAGVAGYTYVSVHELRSGETKTVRFVYFGDGRSVSSISVDTIINVFDREVYIDEDIERYK